MTVKMQPPENVKALLFNDHHIAAVDISDGLVEVPDFALEQAKAQGFTFADSSQDKPVDLKAALAAAPRHELANFLMTHGIDHKYWEKNRHVYSDKLRVLDSDELFTDGPEHKVTITTTKGSLEFDINDQTNLLMLMKITSVNLPPGTRVERVRHVDEEKGIKSGGFLTMPPGLTADDIKTGVDPNAAVVISVSPKHIADFLDDYHGRFHENGPGRIVFYTEEDLVKIAHAVVDGKAIQAVAAAQKRSIPS